MSKDLKELIYDYFVATVNSRLSEDANIKFEGGFDVVFWNGIPNVLNQDSGNVFDWAREEVIPVSEEVGQETPSVNNVDRSDFVFQYQVLFRYKHLNTVKQALIDTRTYLYENKQTVLDDYNVAFKVVRADKQAGWKVNGGNWYGRYKMTLYVTASKGYITKDSDTWFIKKASDETYIQLKYTEDNMGTDYITEPSITTQSVKHKATGISNAITIQIPYVPDESTLYNELYDACTGQYSKNTKYDLREIFNTRTKTFSDMIITNASRIKKVNGTTLMSISFVPSVD